MSDVSDLTGLVLLGAPLGNPDDASPRMRRVLASATVVAAEDTRRLRMLASRLDVTITGRVLSYFEGNERERTPALLQRLRDGDTVAVITDGGMPSVSDPGFRLVAAAVAEDIPVSAVPGPSAVTTALAVSGLPCDRFTFEGFLPRKAGDRNRLLAELADQPRTMVFFESPRRVAASLPDLVTAFGADRRAALCRELTKTYEEVRRGSLSTLLDPVRADSPRGEITLVVAGHVVDPDAVTSRDLAAAVESLTADGVDRRTAQAQVAKRYGVPKRRVYDAVLTERDR